MACAVRFFPFKSQKISKNPIISIKGLDLLLEYLFLSQKDLSSSPISSLNLLIDLLQTEYSASKELVFLLLISFFYTNTLLSLKSHLQKSFVTSLNNDSEDRDLNFLRLRTVHCKGLLPTDVKGTLLKKKIAKFLAEIKNNGEILSILVFPDYSSLLKMEKQRLAIKDLEMINNTRENPDEASCFQRCFPSNFDSLEEYERKFYEIEEKMQEEIEGIIESSNQCFLCFSSMKTAEFCLQKFNSTSLANFVASFFTNLRNRCCYKRNENLERGFFSEIQYKRKISTFNKYSSSIYKEEEEENSRSFQPVMTIAPDPSDINWLNISKSSVSFLFLRRVLTNLLIFLIILFLTTPMALLQALEEELSTDWLSYIPHPFNEILSNQFTSR